MSIKDRYAIVGLGITKQGRLPGMTENGIRAEAILKAIADSGLKKEEIDGYVYQPGGMMGGTGGDVPRMVGLAPKFLWSLNTGGGTAISSLISAIGAIESGAASCVVCSYASNWLSERRLVGAPAGGGEVRSTAASYGMFGPGPDHALAARRHMHEYGTTSLELGAIAVTQRDYANQRPESQMYSRKITLEDHQVSRMIADPLRFLDFCLVSDGGIAFIVTSAERAKNLLRPPVYVMGVGLGHQVRPGWNKDQYTTLDVAPSKEAAFKTAGITLDDIDVAELYDCFTITVLLETEGYGWCKKGEGGAFFAAGNTKIDGKIPMNTGGGNLSWGYNQGFTPFAEAVIQLRGDGGATQVKGAEIALASGHGGTGTGSMQYCHTTAILRR
ncbi:MAG: thiolase family protein [Chloroflexi bacterium]|nr:thiolase family protein [Chloroflexota bacterium]